MRVMLKGIHKTSKTLADGRRVDYFYAWKGGPRINAAPGSPEFIAEFHRLTAERQSPDNGSFQTLIALYKGVELPALAKDTQRAYISAIKSIEHEFGDMPLEAIEERGSRKEFLAWRQRMADRPRTADMHWSVLQRIMSFGVDQEILSRNPCEKAGRLAEAGTRRHIIWGPDDIAKMKATAPQQIVDMLIVAMWTGQRQGDIINLTWGNFDGTHIRLKQSKGGRRISVKASKELAEVISRRQAAMKEKDVASTAIFTTSRGQKWTNSGFRASWRKAAEEAGIKGLTFHDLRGTFVTLARRQGSSIEDIAQITGHSIKDVKSILEQHYLADDQKTADRVIVRMERNAVRTKSPNRLQTAPKKG